MTKDTGAQRLRSIRRKGLSIVRTTHPEDGRREKTMSRPARRIEGRGCPLPQSQTHPGVIKKCAWRVVYSLPRRGGLHVAGKVRVYRPAGRHLSRAQSPGGRSKPTKNVALEQSAVWCVLGARHQLYQDVLPTTTNQGARESRGQLEDN